MIDWPSFLVGLSLGGVLTAAAWLGFLWFVTDDEQPQDLPNWWEDERGVAFWRRAAWWR